EALSLSTEEANSRRSLVQATDQLGVDSIVVADFRNGKRWDRTGGVCARHGPPRAPASRGFSLGAPTATWPLSGNLAPPGTTCLSLGSFLSRNARKAPIRSFSPLTIWGCCPFGALMSSTELFITGRRRSPNSVRNLRSPAPRAGPRRSPESGTSCWPKSDG